MLAITWTNAFGETALTDAEKQGFAQRLFEALKGTSEGFCSIAADGIFNLVPVTDRDDVSRRTVLLGANAASVAQCLRFAQQDEARAAQAAATTTTTITPGPTPTTPTRLSTGAKVAIGGAAVLGVIGLLAAIGRRG